jgi:hypothetical protein
MAKVETGYMDIGSYLPLRDRSEFVLVEIGHGSHPIAYDQAPFTGERAYIGIECWLRDFAGIRRDALEEMHSTYKKQNIFYVDLNVGEATDYDQSESLYEGEYEAETLLPVEAADEVFLSNVFGDPKIASMEGHTQSLLNEVSRLISKNGVVVIRETLTPKMCLETLCADVIEAAGLKLASEIKYHRDSLFLDLEKIFNPRKNSYFNVINDKSFYIFLAKTTMQEAQR